MQFNSNTIQLNTIQFNSNTIQLKTIQFNTIKNETQYKIDRAPNTSPD